MDFPFKRYCLIILKVYIFVNIEDLVILNFELILQMNGIL